MIHIQREMWILVKDNNEVFCGSGWSACFRPINEIKDVHTVRLFVSKKRAESVIRLREWNDLHKKLLEDGRIVAVKVIESINEVGTNNKLSLELDKVC